MQACACKEQGSYVSDTRTEQRKNSGSGAGKSGRCSTRLSRDKQYAPQRAFASVHAYLRFITNMAKEDRSYGRHTCPGLDLCWTMVLIEDILQHLHIYTTLRMSFVLNRHLRRWGQCRMFSFCCLKGPLEQFGAERDR